MPGTAASSSDRASQRPGGHRAARAGRLPPSSEGMLRARRSSPSAARALLRAPTASAKAPVAPARWETAQARPPQSVRTTLKASSSSFEEARWARKTGVRASPWGATASTSSKRRIRAGTGEPPVEAKRPVKHWGLPSPPTRRARALAGGHALQSASRREGPSAPSFSRRIVAVPDVTDTEYPSPARVPTDPRVMTTGSPPSGVTVRVSSPRAHSALAAPAAGKVPPVTVRAQRRAIRPSSARTPGRTWRRLSPRCRTLGTRSWAPGRRRTRGRTFPPGLRRRTWGRAPRRCP